MEINLVASKSNIRKLISRGNVILEVVDKDEAEGSRLGLNIYDPSLNEVTEIAPDMLKSEMIPVSNCIWHSDSAYYASCSKKDNETVLISVYKYYIPEKSLNEIYSFEEEIAVIEKTKHVKIFILTEKLLLIQSEQKKEFVKQNLIGNIEFNIRIVNTEDCSEIKTGDQNLINNGINTIIPVSPTHLMIKTGYSAAQDSRLTEGNEKEAFIESVYYGASSQFISSFSLETSTKGFTLIEMTYKDKYILTPKVVDDYILFVTKEAKTGALEAVFYNFRTGEQIRCQLKGITYDGHDIAFIINDMPYVLSKNGDETGFFNLRTSEVDCKFYGEELICIIGDLFLLKRTRGKNEYLRIYRLPKLDLVTEEKCRFVKCCINNGNYYIYINKK